MAASAPPAHETSTLLATSFDIPQHLATPSECPPQGACDFRELSLGHTCGCRRFSVNLVRERQENNGSPSQAAVKSAWCYCGHHACFHAREERVEPIAALQQVDGYGNTRGHSLTALPNLVEASMHHASLPPVQRPGSVAAGIGLQGNTSYLGVPTELPRSELWQNMPDNPPSTQSSFRLPSELTSRSSRGPRPSPSRQFMTQIINARTRSFVDLTKVSTGAHLPDDARSPTELATASNSLVGSPSLHAADAAVQAANVGLDQLSDQLALQRSDSPLPKPRNGGDASGEVEAMPTDRLPLNDRFLAQISSLKAILLGLPNFSSSVAGLAQRLDALENTSFGHVGLEELQDRHEHIDGRMLDVEGRVEELEKAWEVVSAHMLECDRTDKSQSLDEDRDLIAMNQGGVPCHSARDSVDQSIQTQVTANTDYLCRLDSLERRLSRYEAAALPSPTNPWEIEVVLLPWGRNLKGIWCSELEFLQSSAPSSAESQSMLPERETSPGWSLPPPDNWYYPRAVGPTKGVYGKVYERLKSRGFVRSFSITGNSARDVEFELMWAMQRQLQALQDDSMSLVIRPIAHAGLLGLTNPWIPLRKVHKSSRLRFLTASELATPSLWTADFLHASIFMKAPMVGKRRLFITHPAAYMQCSDPRAEWSWPKIRELRQKETNTMGVLPSAKGQNDVQDCWAHDPRLDQPVSASSSFASASSARSVFGSSFASPPPSPQQPPLRLEPPFHYVAPDNTTGERVTLGANMQHVPITPVSAYPIPGRPSQHLHRTSSVPIATTENADSTAFPIKRQIASFDDAVIFPMPSASSPKRRRVSKTSSGDGVRVAGWGFTPRLSREPPSPALTNAQYFQPPQRTMSRTSDSNRVAEPGRWPAPAAATAVPHGQIRGITPNAYATPFSYNAEGAGTGDDEASVGLYAVVGGDTDVDSDSEGEEESACGEGQEAEYEIGTASGNDEDVWEGVGEEEVNWEEEHENCEEEDEKDDAEYHEGDALSVVGTAFGTHYSTLR